MKLKDMTNDQLIQEISRLDMEVASLKQSEETAWRRWKESNQLTNSYIEEFAQRGLIYISKNTPGNP